ncbi:MAG TPA: TonB-dependent receptor plug domain-containing protein, partial [Longimicrobiales bacterium]
MNRIRYKRLSALLALLICAFCGRASASAPDTLRGRVLDRAGNAIANAEIVVEDIGRMATTASDGSFAVIAPAGATIVVRRAGYAPAVLTPRANAGPINIVLDPSPFMLDPVTVTATGVPITATASLATGTLMREALRREAGVSLAHALDGLPGVRTLSTGEQVGKPVIRGVFGSRVLVLEDALRLEDYSWSDEDAPSIDARFADRVEVVRGPASILYGSDALGGVVNVIPAPVPQPGTHFRRTGVELSLSSNRREGGLVGRTEGSNAALGWRALVVGHFAEDFRTPVGPVENTGYGALNGEVAVGTQKPWGTLTARYARYAGEFKLLEADTAPSTTPAAEEEGGPERKLADDRLQVVGTFPLGGVRLEARAQLQRHWLQEVADELTPPGQPKVEAPVFELLLNTLSTELVAHHSLLRNLRGSVATSLVAQN